MGEKKTFSNSGIKIRAETLESVYCRKDESFGLLESKESDGRQVGIRSREADWGQIMEDLKSYVNGFIQLGNREPWKAAEQGVQNCTLKDA